MLNLFIIHNKIHKPECCTLTYCCWLCRLKMSKSKARHILIFIGKLRNRSNCINKLFLYKEKCFLHCDNICIITNIAACCTKMNDSLCIRALLTICMNMTHNIVAEFLFIFLCHLIVNIICMCFKLFYLFLCNV